MKIDEKCIKIKSLYKIWKHANIVIVLEIDTSDLTQDLIRSHQPIVICYEFIIRIQCETCAQKSWLYHP